MVKEVRRFLLLIASALAIALIVVITLVYSYGSSGTYLLGNVLISPSSEMVDRIEFEMSDASGKGWGRYGVSRESYALFYKKVKNRRSVPKLTDETIAQFDLIAPSTLTIFSQSGALFQQVNFLDEGDLFRVQLRDEKGPSADWIYFNIPNVYDTAVKIFAPEVER